MMVLNPVLCPCCSLGEDSTPSWLSGSPIYSGFRAVLVSVFSPIVIKPKNVGFISSKSTELARYLQSLVSRKLGADIHPSAKFGHSIYLSSATGTIIGETAVVGDHVRISHFVTLGGTGKERGDRLGLAN
jgi:serine acetyltransferase